MYPTHLRYTKDHEWIEVKGDTGTVGITDYAQHELGDIVFVEVPEVGKQVKKGDVLGTIDSVKATSEVYSPVSGSVVEANGVLAGSPEKMNQDPHGEAWICKIRLSDPGELEGLLDAAAYEALVTK